jgi:hypothetical protein
MARSFWIGTLVGVLACTAAGRAAVLPQERVITLRESGKPALKCRVLKCWMDKDGSKICEVQAIDGGEKMTIVEKMASGDVRLGNGAKTPLPQVYHWGMSDMPPKGAPMAPLSAIVVSLPSPVAKAAFESPAAAKPVVKAAFEDHSSSKAAPAAAPTGASKTAEDGVVTLKATADHPELKCRLVKEWTEKDGSKVQQLQVIATGQIMNVSGPGTKTVKSGFMHFGSHEKPRSESAMSTTTVVSTTTTASPSMKTEPVAMAVQPQMGDRLVKVMEAGHDKPHQCRVIKQWSTRDGGKASQFQLLETGEMITVSEPRPGTGMTRLFHWGTQDKPPAGAPVAPADAVVVAEPVIVSKSSLIQAAGKDQKPSSGTDLKPVGGSEMVKSSSSMKHDSAPVMSGKPVEMKERIVKIMEANSMEPLKCRVLKEWTTKDGTRACQLQAIDTGELLSMAQPKSGTGATRVYHWGQMGKAPAGAPVPPANATVVGFAASANQPKLLESPSSPRTAPAHETSKSQVSGDRVVTVTENGSKKPQKCRVIKEWTNKDGTRACQLQVIETGEMMTMTQPVPGSLKADTPRVYHWGTNNTPPQGAPVPPSDAMRTGNPVPTAKPSMFSRLFSSRAESTQASRNQTVVKSEQLPEKEWGKVEAWKPNEPAYHLETVSQPGQAGQKSTSPAQPYVAGATTPAPSLLGTDTSGPAMQPFRTETTSRPSLPMAETTRNDPLSQPQGYLKTQVPASTPSTTEPPVATGSAAKAGANATAGPNLSMPAVGEKSSMLLPMPSAPPVGTTPASSAAPKLISSTIVRTETPIQGPARPTYTYVEKSSPARPSLWGILTGNNPAPAAEPVRTIVRKSEPVAAPTADLRVARETKEIKEVRDIKEPKERTPIGMGSVMAAGSPALDSAPRVIAKVVVTDGESTVKPVNAPNTVGSISIPVTAPNAFSMAMAAPPGAGPAMMPPPGLMMPAAPMAASGAMMAQMPASMNNAFTTGGNTRPIPADMGMAANYPNAFEHGGMNQSVRQPMPMMAGYGPYPMPMAMPMPMPRIPAAPMMMAQAPAQEPQTGRLIATLHGAVMPSEREMAAGQLSLYDWRTQPQVVTALTDAAKNDPAATVRASCIHALAKMKVNTLPAVQTVQALKNDKDVRVRQEVEQALAIMSH